MREFQRVELRSALLPPSDPRLRERIGIDVSGEDLDGWSFAHDAEDTSWPCDWYMAVFDANVPHPAGSNLAFYPPNGESDPTPAQVVKWATSYRPIQP